MFSPLTEALAGLGSPPFITSLGVRLWIRIPAQLMSLLGFVVAPISDFIDPQNANSGDPDAPVDRHLDRRHPHPDLQTCLSPTAETVIHSGSNGPLGDFATLNGVEAVSYRFMSGKSVLPPPQVVPC